MGEHHGRRAHRQPLARGRLDIVRVFQPASHRASSMDSFSRPTWGSPALETGPVGVGVGDQPGADIGVQRGEDTARGLAPQQFLIRARARLQHQRAGAQRQRAHPLGKGRRQGEEPIRGALHIEAVSGRAIGPDGGDGEGRGLLAALHQRGVHAVLPQPLQQRLPEAVRGDPRAERGGRASRPSASAVLYGPPPRAGRSAGSRSPAAALDVRSGTRSIRASPATTITRGGPFRASAGVRGAGGRAIGRGLRPHSRRRCGGRRRRAAGRCAAAARVLQPVEQQPDGGGADLPAGLGDRGEPGGESSPPRRSRRSRRGRDRPARSGPPCAGRAARRWSSRCWR
ncbi:hypothetical protein SANTM175S_04204 [Streptomyces antimycoticus]